MMRLLHDWLGLKWRLTLDPGLMAAYGITFGTPHGQQVLQHLMDSVYCQVYEGTDPQAALVFSAKRSVIHDILQNIDAADNPMKYEVREHKETTYA